ncbi:MAG: NAD-dependent epimerase/dehydratase family protein [Chloroflexota bacterium]
MTDRSDLHVILGTGAVGLTVKDELCKRGYTNIRMVNRSGKTPEPLGGGIELVNGDMTNPAFAVQAAEGAAVVYNALNPVYHKWDTFIMPLWEGVVEAASANHAKLVCMDNLYMYGDVNGEPIHEGMPYVAHTKKGKIRVQAANYLHDVHASGKAQVVIARASDFIGPRVDNSVAGGDFTFKPALQGKRAQVVGRVDMPHSYTYMPDVARALVDLAEADDVTGQVWHIPTSPAVTMKEILEMIYAETGHPLRYSAATTWMVRMAGLFDPEIREVVEMMYEFNQPFLIDSSKFTARFGWHGTDTQTIVEESVKWFASHSH